MLSFEGWRDTYFFGSAGITTPGLIGFVLFIILYFPIIYYIPAYKIQKLLEVQIVIATATLLGIMGWAIHVSSHLQSQSSLSLEDWISMDTN